jgi:predicted Zn-dependent protease
VPLAKARGSSAAKLAVGILSDKSINAANAATASFYVTRGLLIARTTSSCARSSPTRWRTTTSARREGQRLQTGVAVGSAIIEQVIPNAAIITPIAGTLITRKYGRDEELEADSTE